MEDDGTREVWFRIRRRSFGFRGSPSLLMVNRSGEYYYYSLTHRRYIATTRYQSYRSLTRDLAPLIRAYRSLHRLGMSRWPEYDERARREITLLKHRLMDAYWDAAPGERRRSAAGRYLLRLRRKCRMLVYPVMACTVAYLAVSQGRLMLRGRYTASWAYLCTLLAYVLEICFVVAVMEGLITIRWINTPSHKDIYDVLEFEWTN